MNRYLAAVVFLVTALSAQNAPITNKGRHLDIPAISREANGSIVSIVMSDKDGHPIAQGSGFLISKDGHVVTNYHVIKTGSSAVVKLPDGAFFVVEGVLASDKNRDVAIIKAHGNNFRPLTLGDSTRLQVGEEVVAIGNPLSLESTVSNGIVSAIRTVEEEGGKFVQVTAPISPGSSGGPLLNMAGEVVGITTSHLIGGQNLNFAIPINDVKLMLRARVSTASTLPDEPETETETVAPEHPDPIILNEHEPTGFTEAFSTEPSCSGHTLTRTWTEGGHWLLSITLYHRQFDENGHRVPESTFLLWGGIVHFTGDKIDGPHLDVAALLDDFRTPKSDDCNACTTSQFTSVQTGAKAVCTLVKGGGKVGGGKVE